MIGAIGTNAVRVGGTAHRFTVPRNDIAPRLARGLLRDALAQWNLLDLYGDAAVMLSELTTNVHLHTNADVRSMDVIFLRLRFALYVAVVDGDERCPEIGELPFAADDAVCGRGWTIIRRTAVSCGFIRNKEKGGKTAWFKMRRP
ncbi:ATP-binding protein [Actinocorallia sp. API 0066]|uniref:ATP-binding protein n=1 Tax=Actinocorallia sp. API 0066 TaxID=2896846 RepID=UPI001E581704|nr:ATP-binding protein [Actinocorallia sp. API 0066]MCD0448866.1 ATP-binding protein [Actinocorallia sp. API 0066]